MSEAKAWKCSNGHVLGLVRRNGSKVRQLLLYRLALDMGPEAEQVEVDVVAVVEGYVADVRCSVCGAVRTWLPGQESMERLLKHFKQAERASVE